MSISLTQPLVGSTNWGADVNANWQTIRDGINNIDAKPSVRVATTANITLSGTQTIDGIAVIAGDRVLVKNQSATADNGIYVVASGSWTRATDASAWTDLPCANVWVETGTVNASTGWLCTVTQGGTIGSTSITWLPFAGASGGSTAPAASNIYLATYFS